MKTGTNTTSMAQTFIDKSAKLSVKNHQLQLTLHIKQGAGMIADVKTSSNNQPVTVSNDTGEAKDLTFNIASLTAVTNLSLTLKVGTGMPEKMDVQPAPATLKVVQLDQPAVSSSSAASSSNTADESSQVVQPGAASSSSATTSQPIIESSSTQSVTAASSSASKADSAVTQPAAAESKESTTKQESTAKQESTPAGHDSASAVKPETTPEKTATTFDPTHLIDGTYAVPVSILKTNSDDQSPSAGYFGPTATVVVAGDTVKVTLHVVKNASMIAAFGLDGQAATISNKTSAAEDLTFTVNDSFKDAIVPATMTISIPILHLNRDKQARVKFGQALYADKQNNTGSVKANSNSAPKTATTMVQSHSFGSANAALNLNDLHDGTYNLNVPIMKTGLTTASAAQQFISQTVQLVVSNNGRMLKVIFHVTNGLEYIKGMTLAGQSVQIIKHSATAADFIFPVTKATLAGVGQVHFSLATPAGNLEEDAVAVFNLNHQPLTNLLKNTNGGLASVTGGHDLLDASKQVQYVPYKVLDETRSKLSTANNYYTHTAKVVKDASGYKVYLTVQAPTGYVKFQPLSVNYGGYSDLSQSNAGGNDVWTYAFHINSATGLDQPLPATISMTVPIAGISNQQFEIWLVFGKAQGGGTDYLAANTTAEGLPTSTIALAQAANSAVNANSLVLTAAKATQQPAKSATLNQAKKAPNNTKKVAAAALQADQHKTAKLKDYPFMAEIAGFGAVAVAIIGFAIFKRRQV
jgi:heme-binding NEAT domain protein